MILKLGEQLLGWPNGIAEIKQTFVLDVGFFTLHEWIWTPILKK